MVKNCQMVAVSITNKQVEWLNEHDFFILSHHVQDMLDEKIESYNKFNGEKVKLIENIERLQEELTIYSRFLEDKGLFDEFIKGGRAYVREVLLKETGNNK